MTFVSFDKSARIWNVVVDGLADALVEAGHAVKLEGSTDAQEQDADAR